MKTILIGYGNVGKAIHEVLREHAVSVDLIVRKSGVYSADGYLLDTIDKFDSYVDGDTMAYISVPSDADAMKNLGYYLSVLEKGGSVITCEKSVLAHYWHVLRPYMNCLWYSATVGGNSGILPELHHYTGEIREIKAVINGTLNIISEESARGMSEDALYDLVTSQGFAEPGSANFQEVIASEMQDVLYKAVIFANHSGLYPREITLSDIIQEPYRAGARCMLVADKNHIRAGFMYDTDTSWFPAGVNNVLLINGEKIVEGLGAGARATAERMYTDSLNFL